MEPLRKATHFKADDELIKKTAVGLNISVEEARHLLHSEAKKEKIWINEKYQVSVIEFDHSQFGPCMQINIRRRDGNVIFRDWRDFQLIKNQLAGPECEGLEIYPAESRKVDTTNKYHLWVILDPDKCIPFGWAERRVTNQISDLPGHRQRPVPKEELTPEELTREEPR